MMPIPAGPQLINVIATAYQAGLSILLHGRHGVGKSEIFAQAAAHLGIRCIVRDLSLMEPPDLVGIPRVGEDGHTHYAPPAFLPTDGRGLLCFEELNRCASFMTAPCLQLLTAHRLNDYALPPGWLTCAAVNPADGYDTRELDAALLSRFVNVEVIPDVSSWLAWADANAVHGKIRAFVSESPDVFSDPAANPRAWTYASQALSVWEQGTREESLLAAMLSGILGDKWALAFLQIYGNHRRPLQPDEILDAYPAHRAALNQWIAEGHLDVVAATMELFKRFVQPQRRYLSVLGNVAQKANVQLFLADLPGDLQREMQQWLIERGFDALIAAAPRPKRKKRP